LGRRRRCAACGGTGRIRQQRNLPFHIPAGVRHGSILAMTDPALPDGRITVRILIDG
jgi:DnaJ-class molecular chaperone